VAIISAQKYAADNGIDARDIPPSHSFRLNGITLVDTDDCDEWLRASGKDQSTALYRHYDERGNLLYVGISLSALHRLQAHKRSRWFRKIVNVTMEWFPDRESAIRAEIEAIKAERPSYNKVHNDLAH